MDRRDALKATITVIGTAVVGGHAFLSGCAPAEKKITEFTDDLVALLDDLGETILPATSTSPGARAAGIGSFMKVIVTDCYDGAEQTAFFDGIHSLQKMVTDKYHKTFAALSSEEKEDVFSELEQESRAGLVKNKPHIFDMLHQLTVWGYFSSEPGATRALRYIPVPGRYEGCIEYKNGEGAWVY